MLNLVSISPGSPGLYAPFLGPALSAPVQGRPFLMGCEIDQVACGALAASFQREAVRLLWASVSPACQGRGMGRLMMARFMEAVSASGAELAEAAFVLDGPAQIPAANLLRGAGFREAGELEAVGKKYYLPGTVVPEDRQWEAVSAYLREAGFAYCQDLARVLRISRRKTAAVLRRMVADGRLTQFEKRYYLAHQPEEQQVR